MGEKAKTPAVRFKGFTDAWENRKLGDLCDEFQSGHFISAVHISDTGDYPVFGGNGLRGYTSTYNHDGLYALIGRQGALCGNMNISSGKAYFTEHAVVTHANKMNDTQFLFYLFGLMNLGQYSGQSAQPGLAVNKLIEIKILVPQLPEQQKIAFYFTHLDNLITLHQRKFEKLQNVKKAMLEKMFPKNGSNVPETRFAGFTDAWEQYKLEDLCSIITKQTGFDYSATIKPSLMTTSSKSTYSFIQNKDFSSNYINYNTDFYIPQEIANKFPNILLDCPSLLVSISGKIGNVGLYLSGMKACIGGAVGICKLLDKANGHTVLYQLLAKSGQEYFSKLVKASSHANITVEDIRKIPVLLPESNIEKERIGTLFHQMDNLITLHQRKLEKLQNVKKACLEKMFV